MEPSKKFQPMSTILNRSVICFLLLRNVSDGSFHFCKFSFAAASSTEHLITKKRIENTRAAFGSDNWLRCQAGGVVQDILGLPSEVVSSTPYDDLCLVAMMESMKKNVITTTAIIESQTPSKVEVVEKNNFDSFVSCEDNASNYFSIDNSTEKTEVVGGKEPQEVTVASKETSPDIEPIQDSEEENDDGKINIYFFILFYPFPLFFTTFLISYIIFQMKTRSST